MNDKIIKIKACISAANDVAKKSIENGDKFNDKVIDELITKIDKLKAKMEQKLAQQPASSK